MKIRYVKKQKERQENREEIEKVRERGQRLSPPKQGGPRTRIFPFTPHPTRFKSSSTVK